MVFCRRLPTATASVKPSRHLPAWLENSLTPVDRAALFALRRPILYVGLQHFIFKALAFKDRFGHVVK